MGSALSLPKTLLVLLLPWPLLLGPYDLRDEVALPLGFSALLRGTAST